MAMWENCTVTKAGAQLLIEMRDIEIYAAKYGTETVDEEELKLQTDVTSPGGDMSVIAVRRHDWGFEAVIRVDNSKIKKETIIKQVGFFARIKGSEGKGVLFAAAQDETGDRVPAYEEMPNFNLEFTIAVTVDTDAEVSIAVDPSATATVEYLENRITKIKVMIDERAKSHAFAVRTREESKPDYGFTPAESAAIHIASETEKRKDGK